MFVFKGIFINPGELIFDQSLVVIFPRSTTKEKPSPVYAICFIEASSYFQNGSLDPALFGI